LGSVALISALIASRYLPDWRLTVTFYSTLLLAGFFFVMGAAVIGIIWYLQSVANGSFRKGKKAEQSDPNLAEVARLMRDKTNQDLVVTMNGNVFHQATELNPGQSRRLHFASNVLVKWLAEAPPPPPAEGATSEAGLQASQVESSPLKLPADEEWIPAESAPLEVKPVASSAFTSEPASVVKPISTQLTDVVGGILKPAPTSSQTPAFKSIAMQIDEILQEMIANTPFEQRGITVNDTPDHGVMVTLDGKQYPGVKDVPDEEVRNLIRSAVVEWEKGGKFSSH
jgi:hypothetical protein